MISRDFVLHLRELRGAPLSCLLAVAACGEVTTMEDLVQLTGYSRQSVIQAIQYLIKTGWVEEGESFYAETGVIQ